MGLKLACTMYALDVMTSSNPRALCGDQAAANALEQMPPCVLWLHDCGGCAHRARARVGLPSAPCMLARHGSPTPLTRLEVDNKKKKTGDVASKRAVTCKKFIADVMSNGTKRKARKLWCLGPSASSICLLDGVMTRLKTPIRAEIAENAETMTSWKR
eukprot:scaffold168926_cov33-Prasinocladus_malaysianus.AAC.1